MRQQQAGSVTLDSLHAELAGLGPDVLKIACVGDSITRGTFIWHRRKRSYPAQLQAMLGERFCVRNFGVNGHAAQQSADRPYWDSEAFTLSSTFEPDIVLIMLGTNDSRGDNWKGVGPFAADYRKLTEHYQSLESSPRVWLLTPPALFRLGRSPKVRYGMDERRFRRCAARSRASPVSWGAASSTSTRSPLATRRLSGSTGYTRARPARR